VVVFINYFHVCSKSVIGAPNDGGCAKLRIFPQ
jgi:hypothetical protein